MTLETLTKETITIFDSVNHHNTDLDLIVINQMKNNFPSFHCTKDDFDIAVHENSQWGETLFDINWTKAFLNAFGEVYPEAII